MDIGKHEFGNLEFGHWGLGIWDFELRKFWGSGILDFLNSGNWKLWELGNFEFGNLEYGDFGSGHWKVGIFRIVEMLTHGHKQAQTVTNSHKLVVQIAESTAELSNCVRIYLRTRPRAHVHFQTFLRPLKEAGEEKKMETGLLQ